MVRVATTSVWPHETRLERQLAFLDTYTDDVDLFLLQAVNVESDAPGGWEGHLWALLDFFSKRDHHVAHTGDWARELTESTVQPHADIEPVGGRRNTPKRVLRPS